MKITAIKQQAKQQDRYSVFVDEKYSFSLSEAALIDSGLHSGQELSREGLEKLKDSAALDKAYNRVLALIARRPRSEWEVRDYLKRKDYEQGFIDQIVSKTYAARFLDDEAFARMWVSNRRTLKATSRRRLAQELKQKRIDEATIEKVLSEDREETDEREVLRQLIERKKHRYPDQVKLMQYLIRQGFSYDDIKSALSEK